MRPLAREAYPIERAAALAGVPRSTVYYWANHEIWRPSVSAERTRYWSFTDIVALRAIYWLRSKEKTYRGGMPIPRTKMREVRRTLAIVELEDLDLTRSTLHVDLEGRVYIGDRTALMRLTGQIVQEAVVLDALRTFELDAGVRGPDLVLPRPLLRIIPGKLAGEPHIAGTRIRTLEIDALLRRGYEPQQVIELYPFLERQAIDEARDLEHQLRGNLTRAA